jgi:predicted phosphodiesterase
MRFLCVSDIHGHATLLQALMREADAYGWDKLVACGDLCFPGPEPLAVWKILVEHRALCVQGLGDRALAQVDPNKLAAASPGERSRIDRLKQVHAELGELIIARLGKLPPMATVTLESGHSMLVVHGSPADPSEPLTFDMTDDEIIALLGDEPADIVICGGSHVPFEREVADVRIVNVGSVGEAPGGTVAHGAIVVSSQTGFAVRMISASV